MDAPSLMVYILQYVKSINFLATVCKIRETLIGQNKDDKDNRYKDSWLPYSLQLNATNDTWVELVFITSIV